MGLEGREQRRKKITYVCMSAYVCTIHTYTTHTYTHTHVYANTHIHVRAHKNSQRDALTYTNTTGLVASEAKREIGQFIREHKHKDSLSPTAHLGYVQAIALEPTTSVQQTLQTVPSGGPRRHNRKPRERDTKLVSV